MTDTLQTRSDASTDDIRTRNKDVIFAALAEAGIQRVTIDYDGSGDSGQIENIEAWDSNDQSMPFPLEAKIQLVPDSPDHPFAEQNLEAAVETLAWDYLDIHCGWENNDGAFGTFEFSVPDRTITLEHNERYTDYNTTSHEF